MLEHFQDLIKSQLENQFFSGGALLVVFTAILALMRNVPTQIWAWIQRRFITRVDIADHDPAFFWVQKWLGEQQYTKERARLLTASTRTRPVNQGGPEIIEKASGRKRQLTEVVFSPAPGHHLIRFRGHYILIHRIRNQGESLLGEVAYHESLEFRALSREIIRELIYEAREAAFPPEDNRVAIMKATYNDWRIAQRRPPRPADSVVLSGRLFEEIRDDLVWFFGAKEWYTDHGIPYQRGYLLLGPPGNGKTSLVIALASAFDRDVHIIQLAGLNDHNLTHLMSDLPEHAIVLMEDVDRLYHKREKTEDSNDNLTFSGLINAIDGVFASTGRILIMTTNHPEVLDSALIRPGRVDRRFEFKNADEDMGRRLFERFFPEELELAKVFGKNVASSIKDLSMADLQEHLIHYREDPQSAADKIGVRTNHKPSHRENNQERVA